MHEFSSFTFKPTVLQTASFRVCVHIVRTPSPHPARRHRPNDLEPVVQECRHGNTALHKQPQLDATYTFLLNLTCAIGH